MVSLAFVAPDFGRRCRPAPSYPKRRLARCELAASVLCSEVPGPARRAIRMCGVTPLAEPVAWQNHAEFIDRHAFAAPWPTASDGMPSYGMIIILQLTCDAMHSHALGSSKEN